jgi:hypothetical protein
MAPEAAAAFVAEATARLWRTEGAPLAYLRGPERTLLDDTIRGAKLGWTDKAHSAPWKPPGCVVPWFHGPDLTLVKIRPPDAWRAAFPEDRRPPKYIEAFRDPARHAGIFPGPQVIRPGRPVALTEGELDCLALGEAVGDLLPVVTLGSASATLTPAILACLVIASRWYVATDADDAGDRAWEQWEQFPRAQRVRPPGGFKDWTEAKAAGIDLRRWWERVLAGVPAPKLSWAELMAAAALDPYTAAEREAIQGEGSIL